MSFERYDGPAARARIRAGLKARADDGRPVDDDPLVLESIALENTGTGRARRATVTARANLARLMARSDARRRLFRGEITVAEARELGLPVPNRATRRRMQKGR